MPGERPRVRGPEANDNSSPEGPSRSALAVLGVSGAEARGRRPRSLLGLSVHDDPGERVEVPPHPRPVVGPGSRWQGALTLLPGWSSGSSPGGSHSTMRSGPPRRVGLRHRIGACPLVSSAPPPWLGRSSRSGLLPPVQLFQVGSWARRLLSGGAAASLAESVGEASGHSMPISGSFQATAISSDAS